MANTLANIARVVSATTGTGTLTLGAAVTGFNTFADAGITNGQTVTYAIEDYTAGVVTAREVGEGVYTASGTTLTRGTVYSSTSGGAKINCSGTQQVFITVSKEDIDTLGGGGLSDGDYGDVTVSSSGTVWTIDNDAVTYAKMQNTGAGNVVLTRADAAAGDIGETALAASQLLGRGSTGNVAAITLGSGLSMSGTTLSASGGGGGTYGTATLDFGSVPGTHLVTTTITGQTGILSGSTISAWLMAEATATHNAYEHMIVPLRITCGNIVAGVGFDIVAVSNLRLTGTFTCRWEGNY